MKASGIKASQSFNSPVDNRELRSVPRTLNHTVLTLSFR